MSDFKLMYLVPKLAYENYMNKNSTIEKAREPDVFQQNIIKSADKVAITSTQHNNSDKPEKKKKGGKKLDDAETSVRTTPAEASSTNKTADEAARIASRSSANDDTGEEYNDGGGIIQNYSNVLEKSKSPTRSPGRSMAVEKNKSATRSPSRFGGEDNDGIQTYASVVEKSKSPTRSPRQSPSPMSIDESSNTRRHGAQIHQSAPSPTRSPSPMTIDERSNNAVPSPSPSSRHSTPKKTSSQSRGSHISVGNDFRNMSNISAPYYLFAKTPTPPRKTPTPKRNAAPIGYTPTPTPPKKKTAPAIQYAPDSTMEHSSMGSGRLRRLLEAPPAAANRSTINMDMSQSLDSIMDTGPPLATIATTDATDTTERPRAAIEMMDQIRDGLAELLTPKKAITSAVKSSTPKRLTALDRQAPLQLEHRPITPKTKQLAIEYAPSTTPPPPSPPKKTSPIEEIVAQLKKKKRQLEVSPKTKLGSTPKRLHTTRASPPPIAQRILSGTTLLSELNDQGFDVRPGSTTPSRTQKRTPEELELLLMKNYPSTHYRQYANRKSVAKIGGPTPPPLPIPKDILSIRNNIQKLITKKRAANSWDNKQIAEAAASINDKYAKIQEKNMNEEYMTEKRVKGKRKIVLKSPEPRGQRETRGQAAKKKTTTAAAAAATGVPKKKKPKTKKKPPTKQQLSGLTAKEYVDLRRKQ